MISIRPINSTMGNTMTTTIKKMTNHIILPGLTLLAGWGVPANDNRPIRAQLIRH